VDSHTRARAPQISLVNPPRALRAATSCQDPGDRTQWIERLREIETSFRTLRISQLRDEYIGSRFQKLELPWRSRRLGPRLQRRLTRFFDDEGLHLSEKCRHALPWFFLSSGNPIVVEHRRSPHGWRRSLPGRFERRVASPPTQRSPA
jgi:hypothetical protein